MSDISERSFIIRMCEILGAMAMVAALLVVPVVSSARTPYANDAKWPPLAACSLVAAVALVARRAAGGRLPPTILTAARFFAVFIAASLLATVFSRYPMAGLRQTMWFGFWGVMVLATAVSFRGGRWAGAFVGAAMAVGLFTSVAGVLNVFGQDLYGQNWFKDTGWFTLGVNTRIFSTIGLETSVGGFMGTLSIFAFGCIFVFRNLTVRILLGVVGALCAVCLYFSGTRSSEAAFALAVLLFGGLFLWTFYRRFFANRVLVGVVVGLIALAVVGGGIAIRYAPAESPLARFRSLGDIGIRGKIWETAFNSIVDSPVVGHGPGTGESLFPRYRPADYSDYIGYANDYAHSEYLEVFGETGLFGFIPFALLILFPIVQGFRVLRSPTFRGNKRLVLAAMVAVIVMVLHASINVDTRYPDCQMLMWVMIGFLLGSVEDEEPAIGSMTPAAGFAGVSFVVLTCAVLMFVVWPTQVRKPQLAKIDVRLSEDIVDGKSKLGYEVAVKAARRAVDNDPTSLRAMKALIRSNLKAGHYEDALAAALTLQKYAPHYGYVDFYLGLAYSQLDMYDMAEQSFEDAWDCDLRSIKPTVEALLNKKDGISLRLAAQAVIRTHSLD